MQLLHRDKPYNLDEAAARRGTPRRKRKDSRTTAYELTIRIPEERRRHFGGKKKLTRVVFALNKKVDLKGQVRAFEEEKNAVLGLALEAGGVRSTPPPGRRCSPRCSSSCARSSTMPSIASTSGATSPRSASSPRASGRADPSSTR